MSREDRHPLVSPESAPYTFKWIRREDILSEDAGPALLRWQLRTWLTASARPLQSRRSREGFLEPVSGEVPVAGNGSGAAAHFPGNLFARKAFEDPEFYYPAE